MQKKFYGNQSKRNILGRLFLFKIKWVAFRDADLFWSVGLEACFNWKKQILMFTKNSGIYNAEKRLNETVDPEILQFTAY